MDLQTLIEGKFDPVAAIRLLAVRVAALEATADHSVFEGEISTELPEVAAVTADRPAEPAKGDGASTTAAAPAVPAAAAVTDDTPAKPAKGDGASSPALVADVGDGDDADGAGKAAPKVAAAKKTSSTKKKAGS